jgi:hypothetical protein
VPSLSRALNDGVDATLAKPRAAALTTAVSLAAALLAAFVSPVAGAICVVVLFAALIVLFGYALRLRAVLEGPYRVLSDSTTWDLHDGTGKTATVTRSLEVIFNYRTIAFEDFATGDGDQFHRYECNVGHVVHRHRQADRQRVIVALNRQYDRNEPATIIVERDVKDGILGSEEWIRLDLQKRSGSSELVVLFPPSRPPSTATMTERHNDHETTHDLQLTEVAQRLVGGAPARAYKQGTAFEIRWTW